MRPGCEFSGVQCGGAWFPFYFIFIFFKCVVPGNVDMWRMLKGMSPIVFVSDSKYFFEVLRGSNNIEICM